MIAVPDELRPWVRAVSVLRGPAEPEVVLPAGRADLVVSVGAGWASAVLHGPASRPRAVPGGPAVAHVLVGLRAGGTGAVCAEPADVLADRSVALDEVWGRAADRLLAGLAGQPADLLAEAVLAGLLDRARRSAPDPLLAAALPALRAGRPVAEVAAAAGVDRRVLAARMHRRIGFGPKRYARLARFERALSAVRAPDAAPLAAIAARLGFADQAHLTREFDRFAGVSPGRLHRRPGIGARYLRPDDLFKTAAGSRSTLPR